MSIDQNLVQILKQHGIVKQERNIMEHCLFVLFSDSELTCGQKMNLKKLEQELIKFKQDSVDMFQRQLEKKFKELNLNRMIKCVKIYLDEQNIEPEEMGNFLGYLIAYLVLEQDIFFQYASDEITTIDQKIEFNQHKESISEQIFKQSNNNLIVLNVLPNVSNNQLKKIFKLYETFDDQSLEYKMKKIKFNQAEYQILSQLIIKTQVQALGLSGDFKNCLEIAENILSTQFTELKNFKTADNEGIIGLYNDNKKILVFIFYTNDSLYDYQQKYEKNGNLAIIYNRYLIDICENIIIVPSTTFLLNPDTRNPYKVQVNPSFEYQEIIVPPAKDVTLIPIPHITNQQNSQKIKEFKIYPEFSKYLVYQEVKPIYIKVKVLAKIRDNDFTHESSKLMNRNRQQEKDYNFEAVRKKIMDDWSQHEYYFTRSQFIEYSKIMFQQFVKKSIKSNSNSKDELNQILDDIITQYDQEKQKIDTEYNDLNKNNKDQLLLQIKNWIEKKDCNYCYLNKEDLQNNLTEDSLVITQTQVLLTELKIYKYFVENNLIFGKDFKDRKQKALGDLNCNHNNYSILDSQCQTVANIVIQKYSQDYHLIQNVSYQQQWVHKIFVKEFWEINQNFIAQTMQMMKQQRQDKEKELLNLRKKYIEQLFIKLEPIINSEITNEQYSCELRFQQLDIKQDQKSKIVNWINYPSRFTFQLGFNTDAKDVKIQSVQFIDEQQGFVLIQGSPINKSKLFYFNIQNKSSQKLQEVTQFSSQSIQICIDPIQNILLTYDNEIQNFHIGKFKCNTFEEGLRLNYIYNEKKDDYQIQKIISITFMPYSDSIYLINQDFIVFEIKYNSKQLILLEKKVNKGDLGTQKIRIHPESNDDHYDQVQTSYDGKFIILKSKHFIDIYDINLTLVQQLQLGKGFVSFKSFADQNQNFLLIINNDESKLFQLLGSTETITIKSKISDQQKDKSNGNPIIDQYYFGFKKFGPHSDFIGCPQRTIITFLINKNIKKNDVRAYFNSLNMEKVKINVIEQDQFNYKQLKFQQIDSDILSQILISRVPVHVATIENFNLVPLQNGKNINQILTQNLSVSQKDSDLLENLMDLIQFDGYDQYIKQLDQEINVVSIVGKQSSGKSYVLNRYFGTRFDVASTRCTDGIWLSLSQIIDEEKNKRIFVVLDCEGLFSVKRNDLEEMKLCLALAAISDIMILNQDLSFNRDINKLFQNFSKAIGRIKGRNLFKGSLLMLIRDVNNINAPGAYNELESNMKLIKNKNNNFLSSLFQGQLQSQCINHYEQSIFNEEINQQRQQLFKKFNKKRWKNGDTILECFKIVLAQIFIDDDTIMEDRLFNINCEKKFNECLSMFWTGENLTSQFEYEFQHINQTYQFKIQQKEIKFEYLEQTQQQSEDYNPAKHLVNEFESNFKYYLKIHNEWYQIFQKMISQFLKQRVEIIHNYFKCNHNDVNEWQTTINNYIFKLNMKLEQYQQQVSFCNEVCRKCSRNCQKKQNHPGDCSCDTSHICEDICELCSTSEKLCALQYGHAGSHMCSEGHKCGKPCSIFSNNCKFLCGLNIHHEEIQGHNCMNDHPCDQKCQDEQCTRKCQYDQKEQHDKHICKEVRCIHKCQLCDNRCIFPNHLHNELINQKLDEQLNCEIEGENRFLNFHICDNQHNCDQLCDNKGICQVDYKMIDQVWDNSFQQFNYKYFQPQSARLQCKILIQKYSLKHEINGHSCKQENHKCSNQCYECKSFCQENIDHIGKHHTNTHRNKEFSVFVSEDENQRKVDLIYEGYLRSFAVGESCKPIDCTSSCERKGRSHIHLKECLGQDTCEAKIHQFARHSNSRYKPYPEKQYDEYLCEKFWNSLNWEIPVQTKEIQDIIKQCNWICNHESHNPLQQNFCQNQAWHSGDHKFNCKHEKYDYKYVDIVFCVDITGSMNPYLKQTISTIKLIMNKFNDQYKKQVKFSFVGYRDHIDQYKNKYREDKQLIDKYDFTYDANKIQNYIQKINASGGGDTPEAVMDGLRASIDQDGWTTPNSLRFLFHIADAPPHGKEYFEGKDDYPDGCPCKTTIQQLADKMNDKKIRYKLIKTGQIYLRLIILIGSLVNKMAQIFKQHIRYFEEIELGKAAELDVKVYDILTRELRVKELDVLKQQ